MWIKYDSEPILLGDQWTRKQYGQLGRYQKPHGFWITDDSDGCWRSWCLAEGFRLDELTHKHEIDLDETKVLVLRSRSEIEVFACKYRALYKWGPEEEPQKYTDVCIDWPRVAADYDGIIITPYQWSLRLAPDFNWYYVWDCASGCIWNPRAILDIRLVEIDMEVAKPREEKEREAA